MTAQAHPHVTRDLRQAARQGLLPARGSGWMAGFGNMLAKELGEWFRTRRWLWQILIWLTLINGLIGFLLFVAPRIEFLKPMLDGMLQMFPSGSMASGLYFTMAVMGGTIGAIILAQDEIIQEKQSGTAAWILSKPAARPAFILTKLLSNITSMLVFIIALPGLITLVEHYLATRQVVPMASFLAGTGVVLLALVFYLSLVILLGVLFESRGPVLGIAFGIMFAGMFIANIVPQIAYVLPLAMDKIALLIVLGIPLPAMLVSELIVTSILSFLFILVALWRFQRFEL